ncbi:energy-coupling factor transporter transmembrane protein EcfT [Skermania sp. ID1734]|uniref:energy-coupling factor transporter transmembrane component T family protein n=1 Tax=Skermania sp. ID1734 TaxID=2597516 RepID=UPI00117DD18D|nr:energy-coupling factor transporter transmembrane protein EcfT [Skermania sp. ID1734]TSD99829.1 energy-coupling factor transporter transmembrane protein EcfT [Skermania sp. ID1734]
MVLLRRIPADTSVHRLWAGTKIVSVLALSILLMYAPSWPVLGLVTAFLVGTAALARVPLSAIPRPPWWFWGLLAIAFGLVVPVGLGAVVSYLQLVLLGFLLLGISMLIAWTTPLNEVAPALATLGAPLRRLRLPIDEWAVAVALCLRSLPLLIEEMRILKAARRLRPKGGHPHGPRDNSLIDLITAVMSVSMRRASELGEAITARGGTGQLTAHPTRPGRPDATAAVLVAAICVAGSLLQVLV